MQTLIIFDLIHKQKPQGCFQLINIKCNYWFVCSSYKKFKPMKSFFKYLLATIVGILITTFLVIIIGIGIISAIGSKDEKPVNVKDGSVLVIKLNKPVVDRQPEIPFEIPQFEQSSPIGLNVLIRNIEKAAKDDNIDGIYLEISSVPIGHATLEEIRTALQKFRESGKFIYSYSDYYSQGAYYLASISNKVFLNPAGMFLWMGASSQRFFYKDALKKLGVKPEVVRIGKYKSYAEQFTNDKMSKENREQTSQYLTAFWDEWTSKITESRGISRNDLDNIASNLLIKTSADAKQYKFIDSIVYKDQMIDILKSKVNAINKKKLPQVSLRDYDKVPDKRNYKGLAKDKIALIYASGGVVSGTGDEENIGSEKYGRLIRKIRKDSTYKAIVLRINSPGGSSLASEDIWREVKLATKSIPVIVSMGDVAASGGYYIACPADTILVDKLTITGSIGVFIPYFTANGLLDKLGIDYDVEKTHPHADLLNAMVDITDAERTLLEKFVEVGYDTFVNHVADGRSKTFDEIHTVAQGRVWAGKAAINAGLADAVNDLSDAVEIAAKMADVDEKYRVVELPKQEDPITKILGEISGSDAKMRNLLKSFGINYKRFKLAKDIYVNGGTQYAMPYELIIR